MTLPIGTMKVRTSRHRAVIAGLVLLVMTITALGWRGRNPDELREAARQAMAAGQLEDAVRLVEKLRSKIEFTAEDHTLAARAAARLGDIDQAVACLSQIRVPDPMFTSSRLLAAELEMQRDRMKQAHRHLIEALAFDPTFMPAHQLLVNIYTKQARWDLVVDRFAKIAGFSTLTPDEMAAWNRAWLGLPSDENTRDDLNHLLNAIEGDPSDMWSHLRAAELLASQGQFQMARAVMSDVVDETPAVYEAWARLEWTQGHRDAAMKWLLRCGRDQLGRLTLEAEIALDENRPDDALRALNAISTVPSQRLVVDRLRLRTLTALGRTAEADRLARTIARLEAIGERVETIATGPRIQSPSVMAQLAKETGEYENYHLAQAWYRCAATPRVDDASDLPPANAEFTVVAPVNTMLDRPGMPALRRQEMLR